MWKYKWPWRNTAMNDECENIYFSHFIQSKNWICAKTEYFWCEWTVIKNANKRQEGRRSHHNYIFFLSLNSKRVEIIRNQNQKVHWLLWIKFFCQCKLFRNDFTERRYCLWPQGIIVLPTPSKRKCTLLSRCRNN